MSIIDFKYENAARVLMDSEDEVLQTAGMIAVMRLETLRKRLRGVNAKKSLSIPTNTPDPFAPKFPSPWWQNNSYNQPRFTFGYQPNQTLFGQSSSAFGGQASQPSSGAVFGAAPQTQGFGMPQPSNFTFGSAPQSSGVLGSGQTQTFGSAPPAFGSANTTFGIGATAQTGQKQGGNNSTLFGSFCPTQPTSNEDESEPVPALSVPKSFENQVENSQEVDKEQLVTKTT